MTIDRQLGILYLDSVLLYHEIIFSLMPHNTKGKQNFIRDMSVIEDWQLDVDDEDSGGIRQIPPNISLGGPAQKVVNFKNAFFI